MTIVTALAALDAPHWVMDDTALTERSTAILDDFLAKLGAAPREDLDATAERLMTDVWNRLEDIDNPVSRAVATQNLLNVMDARTERERLIRDVHLGVLVWPWHLIQVRYAAELDALNARLSQDDPEYAKAREAINDRRRRAERRPPWSPGTPWSPKDLHAHGHVSRGLINSRVIPRLPHPVPEIPEEVLVRESERAGRVVRYISDAAAKSTKDACETLRDVVEGVRNDAVLIMLGSPSELYERTARDARGYPRPDRTRPPQRGLAISNADVARELGMKTSRVAQLRTGNG